VRLFEDRNFAGALVEFEASYQKNPTAVALQNIAKLQWSVDRETWSDVTPSTSTYAVRWPLDVVTCMA